MSRFERAPKIVARAFSACHSEARIMGRRISLPHREGRTAGPLGRAGACLPRGRYTNPRPLYRPHLKIT